MREKQKECRNKRDSNFVWLSDEFYIIAQEELPSYEDYEDFPQLENGVGLVRLLWQEFTEIQLPQEIVPPRSFTVVTGVSGQEAMEPLIERLNKIRGLTIQLKVVENSFFGPSVTVTGLLTGTCLREGLKDITPGTKVLIPSVMMKTQEDRFLDDLTPEDLAREFGISIFVVPVKAEALIEQVLVCKEGDL